MNNARSKFFASSMGGAVTRGTSATASKGKPNESRVLFCVGFFILYAKVFSSLTTLFVLPQQLDSVLLASGSAFLLLHCLKNLSQYRERILLLAISLAAGVYIYRVTGETAPFIFILVVVSASTAGDGKWLIGLWIKTTGALIAFLGIVYIMVMIGDPDSLDVVYRNEAGVITRTRYSFFFRHPNLVSALCMMLVCTYLYLKSGRITGVTVVGSILFSTVVFSFTNSRTSFILACLSPFLFFLQQRRGFFGSRKGRKLMFALPVVLFALTFLLSGPLYSNEIGDLLTGRVWLWHVCFDNQGISLFGQPFQAIYAMTLYGYMGTAGTLDSFYASSLFVFGLLFCTIFCSFYWSCLMSLKSPLAPEHCILFLMLLFGVTEVHMLNLVVSPGILLLGQGLIKASGGFADMGCDEQSNDLQTHQRSLSR